MTQNVFMSALYLVRHGQASFGKSNYDKLSDLGILQAQLLGQHFRHNEIPLDRLVTGSLLRHRETAEAFAEQYGQDIAHKEENPDWNEFDFEALAKAYVISHPDAKPESGNPKAFFHLLRKALVAWSRDEIEQTLPESWSSFQSRIQAALDHSRHEEEKTLVVSSGGSISMALSLIMGFDAQTLIDLNLQTRNTAVTELFCRRGNTHVVSFNGIPHLEHPDKKQYISYA